MDETLQGWPSLDYIQELVGDAFELVASDQPDFVFFGPHPRRRRWPRLGRWSPLSRWPRGRYVRIFWTGENRRPDFEQYDWCFTFDYDDMVGSPRHYRRPVWHEAVPVERGEPLPRFEKTRFCNFIYSRPVPFREEFSQLLARYKPVDAPGMRLNNMPPIGSYGSSYDSRYSGGWENEKREFLKPYKFTIAFENESHPGYTTEKLYDAMMVDSIPIYWGNPLVERDYNTRSFINWHDLKSHEAVVARVIEMDRDETAYRDMLRQCWYNNAGEDVRRHRAGLEARMRQIFDEGLRARGR